MINAICPNLAKLAVLLVVTCPVSFGQAEELSPTVLLQAIHSGDTSQLSATAKAAIASATVSAQVSANLANASPALIQQNIEYATNFLQKSKEAFVAALPPRDQARGASIMLGDHTLPGSHGRLMFFVSRSMPVALLRAYALDAMYTGSSLFVKGARKGDTIKEYLESVMAEFNNADGQTLASIEINPNFFDAFDVQVAPTVVWSNMEGLDDVNIGCAHLAEGTPVPQVTLGGPNDTTITMDKPTCAPAPETGYVKIAGALNLPYVLDRFQASGVPQPAMDYFRHMLAERHGDVASGNVATDIGNGIAPIAHNIHLDALPRSLLESWKEQLDHNAVQRSPFGPIFGGDAEEDPVYRKELVTQINHGLGLAAAEVEQ